MDKIDEMVSWKCISSISSEFVEWNWDEKMIKDSNSMQFDRIRATNRMAPLASMASTGGVLLAHTIDVVYLLPAIDFIVTVLRPWIVPPSTNKTENQIANNCPDIFRNFNSISVPQHKNQSELSKTLVETFRQNLDKKLTFFAISINKSFHSSIHEFKSINFNR